MMPGLPSSHPRPPSGTRLRPGRVLVIDDQYLFGQTLKMTLDEHHVVVETEAAAALERFARGERFDLILCDLMMPWMDGIEFHRRLSLTLPHEANRIVFISGGAETGRVQAFFLRVPNMLLEKPVDLEGLRALIERRIRASAHPATAPRAG